jgi:hypothetical protein
MVPEPVGYDSSPKITQINVDKILNRGSALNFIEHILF